MNARPLSAIALSLALAGAVIYGSTRTQATTNTAGSVGESDAAQPSSEPKSDAPLIVHEWGTFTNYSGSDGVKLDFRPLVENDLPGFVDRLERRNGFWLGKSSIRSIQRMETPVTYFYTPVERDVNVRVAFPEGVLTEFFPPVRSLTPKMDPGEWYKQLVPNGDITPPPMKDGLLDWGQVHLIPTKSLRSQIADEELARRFGKHLEQELYHDASRFPHYNLARATDSAVVQLRQDKLDHFEKFLFYRGVGNFELPLSLVHDGDDRFTLSNNGDEAIRSLFLVSVRGDEVRFGRYDEIGRDAEMTMAVPANASSIDYLASVVIDALVAEGLYEKEAKAMVDCWRSSWFGEEGTRLLYMVPQSVTDELIPLSVSPTPDETVRVLVGRMEILSQDEEERVEKLVETSSKARAVHQVAVKEAKKTGEKVAAFASPVLPDLTELGRFAEPALVRVGQLTDRHSVKQETRYLIRALQADQK